MHKDTIYYLYQSIIYLRKDPDIEMFIAEVASRTSAEIRGGNLNTVRVFPQRLQKLIAGKLPYYELPGVWIVFFLSPASFYKQSYYC